LADDINLVAKIVLIEQLEKRGVALRFHSDVTELVGRTARMRESGTLRSQDFDAVVWTARSSSEETAASERFPHAIAIGECGSARTLRSHVECPSDCARPLGHGIDSSYPL